LVSKLRKFEKKQRWGNDGKVKLDKLLYNLYLIDF